MTGRSIDDVRFSDAEVREILKGAAEAESPASLATGDGLSLAELKAAGQEVGISPQKLEASAQELVRRRTNKPNRLLGMPRTLYMERTAPGELAREDAGEVLAAIRRNMESSGEAQEIHGAIEWTGKSERGERHVMVSSRNGQTVVRASSNLTGLAVITYMPAGMLGAMATGIIFTQAANAANEVGMVVSLLILPALYFLLRSFLGLAAHKEAARLEGAVEDVVRLAESSGDPHPGT